MKEFRGTKGEWTTYFNGSYWEVILPTDEERTVVNTVSIFRNVMDENGNYHSGYNNEEPTSNAKLIAASPDLLEACIEALEMCNNKVMPNENDLTDMADVLTKAITKALGE